MFVIVKECENRTLLNVAELCFKTEALAYKTVHKDSFADYKKELGLKPITFREFEEAFLAVKEKKDAKLKKIISKIKDYTDTKKFPEFRHYLYELNSGLTPLLTEGMLKLVTYVRVYSNLRMWDTFESDLEVSLEGNLTINYTSAPEFDEEIFEAVEGIIEHNYCDCVVKSNKYIFDIELELDEEDEEPKEEKKEE